MNAEKHDRRARRTEKQLKEALLKLLNSKNISQISVRELADEADITRATFYKHYRDAFDMLTKLQDEILNKILDLINQTTGNNPYDFFLKLYKYLANEVIHPEILFINTDEGSAFKKIGKIIIDNYMLLWSAKPQNTEQINYEYYRTYTVYGCISVIESWIKRGMIESPEYISELSVSLMPYGRIISKK